LAHYQIAVAELEAIIGAQLYVSPNEQGETRKLR